MKILIVSDSHGNIDHMVQADEHETPDRILHLGDCWQDGVQLQKHFPMLPLEQVPGNCDFHPEEPPEKLLFWEDKRILLCHGHTYGVKQSLLRAGYAAEQEHLDLFLFGHTHQPLIDRRGRTFFLNPGSIGDHLRPSYGIVTLEDGRLDGRIGLLP